VPHFDFFHFSFFFFFSRFLISHADTIPHNESRSLSLCPLSRVSLVHLNPNPRPRIKVEEEEEKEDHTIMFGRAASHRALRTAKNYQKTLLELEQLSSTFPESTGRAMKAHANLLDAVEKHKENLFEYGHTKKEKPMKPMEGLLSREALREGEEMTRAFEKKKEKETE